MKFVLRDLMVGQSLHGEVSEVLSATEFLISFGGDLVRAQNESRRPLNVGDPITVIVRAIDPLRFQLLDERSEQRRKGHIDLSV